VCQAGHEVKRKHLREVNVYKILAENLMGKDHLEGLHADKVKVKNIFVPVLN
jgi:hypothetical protein